MDKELYLSDEQYVGLLDKVEMAIHQHHSFQVIDSTDIGNKYTTSNVGLCNEDFTELDTAMFPEYYLEYGRKSMKYRLKHHICPFDNRLQNIEREEPVNMSNGCYYTCSLRNRRSNKEKMFSLVERTRTLLHETNSKATIERLNNRYFDRD